MKKWISGILALALLALSLMMSACGGTPAETTPAQTKTEPVETTAEATAATTSATAGTTKKAEQDGKTEKLAGYEDLDFHGKKFVIAAQDNSSGDGWYTTKEVYPDATMTDAISIAIRQRNAIVENLYSCKIEMLPSASPQTAANTDITSQKYTIDLYTYEYGGTGLATSGSNYNLLNYINVENPWWDQNYVHDLTIRNQNGVKVLCGIVGDFALTSFACTHVMFYNKTVYDNAGIPFDLYDLVKKGEWTMDLLTEIIQNAKYDADGNQEYHYSDGDTLGWIRVGEGTHGMHVASGLRLIDNNDGVYSFSAADHTDEWYQILDQAIEIWNVEGAETKDYTYVQNAVEEGKALFASEVLEVLERMKDAADLEVGLLPYPKYSESQEGYAHYVDNHFAHYCMPVSVTDPELTGDFFEVYAYHSRAFVREAILNAYSTVYCSDAESGEMLDFILNSRTYDPGYLYWSEFSGLVSNMVSGTNNFGNFVSKYTSIASDRIHEYVTAVSEKIE